MIDKEPKAGNQLYNAEVEKKIESQDLDKIDSIKRRLKNKNIREITFEQGENIEMKRSRKNMFLPSLKSFKYVKYMRSDTKRWSQIFLCEYSTC